MIPHTKVFVGSLPPGSKPEELRRLFENYGIVTECDIMNRCGFVHMETPEMAENAIRALNNTNFKGSNISVEPGRMKDRDGPCQGPPGLGGGGGLGRGGGRGGGRMGGGGDRRGGLGGGGGMRREYDNSGGGGAVGGPRGGGEGGGPRGFGNQNNMGGGGMRGGPGPMRRDRGFTQRGGLPYNRNSGGVGGGGVGGGAGPGGNPFDKWQGGGGPKGGNRNYEDNGSMNYNNGSQGGMGNLGQSDRFNSGGFGMGNQDRRGFALPESRQMYGNEMGEQSRGPPVMGGNTGGRGSFRGGNQGYERRQPGNFSEEGDTFTRRTGPGGGGNMNFGGRGGFNRGGGGGHFSGEPRGGGNLGSGPRGGGGYNQSFPPLGAGGNRNGPRRDMPNRRY